MRRERVAKSLLPHGKRVLDYGAGNGIITERMNSWCKSVRGFDVASYPGQTSRIWVSSIGRIPAHYYGEFDCATCFEVLEHCASDESALDGIHRCLVKDGLLFVTVPNRAWPFETHAPFPLNRIPGAAWIPKRIHDGFARARVYSRKDLIRLLESCGFSVLESGYINASYDIGPKWARRLLGRGDTTRIPVKATSVYALARKVEQ